MTDKTDSKFTSHKEKRKVSELMDSIILPLSDHLKEDESEYIKIGLRIIRNTECEEDTNPSPDNYILSTKYEIYKLPQTTQDITSCIQRFLIQLTNDSSLFICKRLQERPDHIYFTEKTQIDVNGDLLDEIETDILKHLI